jgi:hypothetical protein
MYEILKVNMFKVFLYYTVPFTIPQRKAGTTFSLFGSYNVVNLAICGIE